MNYQQAVAYVHSFKKFGWMLGRLERIKTLLHGVGNPQQQLKFIHVAGTNGKGTVTAMCSTILTTAGYRCGMFISPYVLTFRERFQINGEMIDQKDFAQIVSKLQPVLETCYPQGLTITEFEVITVIGLIYFAKHKCDVVCLETGLGGGDDATNVIDDPLVSVITAISLDHMDILGTTLTEIATHKAGIIKSNTPCVTYPKQSREAVAVLQEKVQRSKSQLILPDVKSLSIQSVNIDGATFDYQQHRYAIQLAGIHQIYNAMTAIETMQLVNNKGFCISLAHIQQGLARTTFPARFQRLQNNPLVIADIAHNSQSIQGLMETLQQVEGKKIFIVGVLVDKEVELMLEMIASQAKHIVCITPDSPRAMDGAVLCEKAQQYVAASFQKSYHTALLEAKKMAGKSGCVVICGSFFVMKKIFKIETTIQ